MPFQWDWLKPVVQVPYVPTLGPVHPATLDARLFEDVLRVAGTGRFLPYDKDRRWSDRKQETVLVDAIEHRPGRTLIPAVDRRGTGRLTVNAYGCHVDGKVVELAFKLAAANDAATARVLTFYGPGRAPANESSSVQIWLGNFTPRPGLLGSPAVEPLDDLRDEVRATFVSFADRLARDGFSFLHRHMQAGDVGPVLVATDASRVIGAIGPMETMRDSAGAARLLPPYFGFLPEHRVTDMAERSGGPPWNGPAAAVRTTWSSRPRPVPPPTGSISPRGCARLASFARQSSSSRLRAGLGAT